MIPTQKSRRASVADAVWCDDWKEEKVRQDLR
jgi:hypothetical protein